MIIDSKGRQITSYDKEGRGLILTDPSLVEAYKKETKTAEELKDLKTQINELKTLLTQSINKQ